MDRVLALLPAAAGLDLSGDQYLPWCSTGPRPSARPSTTSSSRCSSRSSLVILVVFLFLRNLRATVIPGVAVPISLIGTFGVMYLCGYSLDNLSLMALTISTGFVVDDAIVVIENISRYSRTGHGALRGGRARSARDRIHGRLDQRFAGRGVHPDLAHGRDRRPAVPRIRGHPLGGDRGLDGCLADHHADDVRQAAASPKRRSSMEGFTGPVREFSTAILAILRRGLRGCCGISA